MIDDQLPFPDHISFMNSSRTLRTRIAKRAHNKLQLFKIENSYFRNKPIFACYKCKRLRKGRKFLDTATRGARGKLGRLQSSRRCIDCVLLSEATLSGASNVVLRKCGDFRIMGKAHCYCPGCEALKPVVLSEDNFGALRCIECQTPLARDAQERDFLDLGLTLADWNLKEKVSAVRLRAVVELSQGFALWREKDRRARAENKLPAFIAAHARGFRYLSEPIRARGFSIV